MPVRRPEGAALLVAGHGAPGVGAFDASAVHTLGQIGEALLATGTPWQIRRLTASAGDRNAADRPTLKRSLVELANDPVRVTMLVLLGEIIAVAGELALVTGPEAREYPEDATLPLGWIRDRLEQMKAEQVVVVVSARGDGSPTAWLQALGTQRGHHVIAIDEPTAENRLVSALLTGVCGDALDPRTGTVTMASLSTYLARFAQTVQPSTASETVAQPPPLAGLWDVRRSQLAQRVVKRAANEPEDLTGSVLPGRFRIDRVVARGTFGTVYRARQLAVERDVAIKVLHADIDPSSEDGRLFVHEIRSVGRIDHTNVVRIYQADMTHDGRLFFAMELLDGQDLQTLGAGEQLPRARAVELVRQLLGGLGAAHEAGLVHADIKPANAIVVSRGKRATASDPQLGRHRKLVVTPAAGVPVDASLATDRHGGDRELETMRTDVVPAPATVTSSLAGDGVVAVVESAVVVASRPSPSLEIPAVIAKGSNVLTARGRMGSSPNPAAEAEVAERVVLVDFGLARLRAPDRPAESAGGTPAYMAPEQLHEGRVDARSDLFSVALVLVWLMTGWRRMNAIALVPPLDIIADADLRAVLARALDKDPAKRYQTARELAAALTGNSPAAPVEEPAPFLPFRHLAPLTEADRGRLHGRETDLAVITEHALYRRAVIYTAPSGTGKTSILRAGLLPRLEALGIHAVYVRCRADSTAAVIASIAPGASSIADAITTFHEQRGGKLVLVLDQLEAALIESAGSGDAPRLGDASHPRSSRRRTKAGSQPPGIKPRGLALAGTPDPTSSALAGPTAVTPTDTVRKPDEPVAAVPHDASERRPPKLDEDDHDEESTASEARGEDFIHAILGFDRWPKAADVTIVLSVREDYLARLVAYTQSIESGIPVIRLPPLAPDGARTAIVAPLAEARLAIEPDLLEALLGDLERAAKTIAPEMGWSNEPAVFPPHLQLACSVLYEALAPGERTIALAHYRRLGGFDAIVGEHLERVIETELDDGRDLIARDLFLALVTGAHERAIRPESELLAMCAKHGASPTQAVLEVLRSRGLVMRVRGDAEPSWELVHDSLVSRVLAWIDKKDLARRRAIELVRYHLRRSTPESPSLLSRRELRELRPHRGALAELDEEWQRRDEPADAWTPSRLVARSKQVLRRRTIFFSSVLVTAITVGAFGFYRSHVERERARAEASLRERDLGRFTLSLEQFDWDPRAQKAIPRATDPAALRWQLRRAAGHEPAGPFDPSWVVRSTPRRVGDALVEDVEAHGGPAFLIVERTGCSSTMIPIQKLPGYAERDHAAPTFRVHVPTCAASRADMIEIPAGAFLYGGAGEPPSANAKKDRPETRVELGQYYIDRVEVSNQAFGLFAEMANLTGIHAPHYPNVPEIDGSNLPMRPVTSINWHTARAYCRFLGKVLPTTEQWTKAMRGGEKLPSGAVNPSPRRNFPWGTTLAAVINIRMRERDLGLVHDIGTTPDDASPYGVRDLAGSITEWTDTPVSGSTGSRIVRGGNFAEVIGLVDLADSVAIENLRAESFVGFGIGVRCASEVD